MPVKVLKLISDQSGPFTSSNNKVDITVPSYIQYSDLSKTCVVINLELFRTDTKKLLGLFDSGFESGLDATCLIKNCSISSTNVGNIESVAAVNVLTANMKQLTHDFEDLEAQRVYGYDTTTVAASASDNDTRNGSFLEKVRIGSNLTQTKSYLKIPLSTLFGIAKMSQFPNGLFGDLKISLEFEDDPNIIAKMFRACRVKDNVLTETQAAGKLFKIKTKNPNNSVYFVGQTIKIF